MYFNDYDIYYYSLRIHESTAATIGGGDANAISFGTFSTIVGGVQNVINGGINFIGTGSGNIINIPGPTGRSSVLGGDGNEILSPYSNISGGCNNRIFNQSPLSAIDSGMVNIIHDNSEFSVVQGGLANEIGTGAGFCGSQFSFIGNGGGNRIEASGIDVALHSTIVNGKGNTIDGNTCYGFIGNGTGNNSRGFASSIVNGDHNNANSLHSFIGNGCCNEVTTPSIFSFIGDGCQNRIGGTAAAALGADYGFIGSGQNNCIDTGAAMSAATPFGVIGGGQNNTICAGATHSAIVGGHNNCALGQCSVILGGSNNNDGGIAHTAVFGNGISATFVPGPSSFWADELVVPSIPIGSLSGGIPTAPGGFPPGSLWYYPDANGNNVVYVI